MTHVKINTYMDMSLISTGVSTSTAESREAMARISAHETVCGHAASSAALMVSITGKPLTELIFALENFSEVIVSVLFSRTDPSHP